MRLVKLLSALMMVLASLAFSPVASAKTSVKWQKVVVRSGKDAERVSKVLRRYLKRESRHAKWGKHRRLKLAAKVAKLTWEDAGDVVRIRIVVVGRRVGGKSVRSSIRLGGRPNERRKLEKDALKIVASGLVTRLSNIARATPPKKKKRKKTSAATKKR